MAKDYTDILLEDMNGKFDLLLELMTPLKQMQSDIKVTKEDVAELKTDVRIIKAAVTDSSHQVRDHNKRITKLEAKLA